jgi:hypothetical protein
MQTRSIRLRAAAGRRGQAAVDNPHGPSIGWGELPLRIIPVGQWPFRAHLCQIETHIKQHG